MEHLQKLQDELQTMKQHRMLVASFLVPNSNNSNNENDVIGFVHLDHRPPPTNAYLKLYVILVSGPDYICAIQPTLFLLLMTTFF